MAKIITITQNYDHEISDFLQYLRKGEIDFGILVYRFGDDVDADVIVIGEEDINTEEIRQLFDAGKMQLEKSQDIISEE